ncbi:serine/threonine protein kinase [Micromonospora profundi]|uniref:protein kinase domain-containing protein n=1 Tax=Micromonospora profundi TaxID=1420889 RepID=UPI00143A9B1B|nr:protein kinase [Micromonospora profundi]NJC12901.1 serine/threonine protein kinase [Micromonospora profundi]
MSRNRALYGNYEVGDLIGWGGMANIRLGRDIRSGRSVAIKVLRRDLALDPLFQSRFRREARMTARLSHPAIVSVYDTGYNELEGGSAGRVRVPYIVMEYVSGRPLSDLLKAGGLRLKDSIQYQVEILSALEFSHRAGIVHRDIKPANVMITTEGSVKIVDFGIAHDSGDPVPAITQAHEILGTPQYLSPEQVRGETVDARSDLYSAGCLLYELLTGRPPFIGPDPLSVAYQHVYEEPALFRSRGLDLTPALDSVLVKALAKAREDRFRNARAFREALQSAAKGIISEDGGARLGKFENDAAKALAMGGHAGMASVDR